MAIKTYSPRAVTYAEIDNTGIDGWTPAGETWAYASATTFTVAGVDVTAKFSKGTRIKLTQSATVKYFVVTGSSFSTNTTVTITGGTDYTFINNTVILNYYSYAANPQGYPTEFSYAPTVTGFSGTPTTEFARFSVNGNLCQFRFGIQGTSNATTFTVTLPITRSGSATANDPYQLTNVRNSGTYQTGVFYCDTTTTVYLYATVANGAFTASGTKEAYATVVYRI